MKKNILKWALPLLVLFTACDKDDVPAGPSVAPAKGLYVLSEGNFFANNTKLAFYNLATSTVTGSYYEQQNPSQSAGLGDTGNDMVIYGSKLYIMMNVSSQVTVLNAATGVLIKKIPFKDGSGNDKLPRYAVATRGKIYVSSSDNTVSVIDTTALAITSSITVGSNPEGMSVAGNYLYVANSGGFNYPNVDSTVSVVDLSTQAEIKKIKVGRSPNRVETAANGDVFVSAYGVQTIPASVSVINSSNNTLKTTLGTGFAYSHLKVSGNLVYMFNNYGGTGTSKLYNAATGTVVRNEFITDGTVITTPYGINVNEENGDVYITDAKDFSSAGSVTCFDKDGKKKFSFSVSPGVNPNKVLFIR